MIYIPSVFVVNLFSFATVLLTVNMFEITEIKYVFFLHEVSNIAMTEFVEPFRLYIYFVFCRSYLYLNISISTLLA